VKALGEYDIQFSGLKEGIHEFDFDVQPGFFEYFDDPDYPGGSLKVKVILDRRLQLLTLHFTVEGSLKISCDRCLEEMDYPVSSNEVIFVRFGDHNEELDDNVIMIPREDHHINVARFIFEFAILNLPMKRIHPDNDQGLPGCNAEMLDKLAKYSSGKDKHSDPRWDILQKIFKT
jgi:uncharacterized metal-binding protein YceD (DUF177 family)